MCIQHIRIPLLSNCIAREGSTMKRFAQFFLMAGFIAFVYAAASTAQAGEDGCAREDLAKTADRYFASIREHKTSELPLASTAKFTENGVRTDIGKGFWE